MCFNSLPKYFEFVFFGFYSSVEWSIILESFHIVVLVKTANFFGHFMAANRGNVPNASAVCNWPDAADLEYLDKLKDFNVKVI
jgi:hypothetical protein